MLRAALTFTAVTAFSAFAATAPVGAASVGSPAPKLEPQTWLNAKGQVGWDTLKGRVILVERWATT